MNEQANGQLHAPSPREEPSEGSRLDTSQGTGGPGKPEGYGEPPRFTVDKAKGKAAGTKNEAVLGPFTVRDLTVFGATLILFISSLIPMFAVRYNLWNLGSLFFLGLGVVLPLIVTALFVARRVSPATKIRIGSLSVDQFASVVASFAVAFFFLAIAGAFVPVMLLALAGALVLFAATVLARLIPFFAGDFLGRAETPAHVVARETAVPVRKPHAPKAPKEAKEPKAPKEAGANPVAGWAKRMTPGGRSAAPAAAPRGYESYGAASGPAAGAAAAGPAVAGVAGVAGGAAAAAPSAAPAAPASQVTPAAAGVSPAPVFSSPETQVTGIVPAASAPAAPSSAAQTGAPGPSAAGAAPLQAADEAPSSLPTPGAQQPRAAAAAEETRAADVPAGSSFSAPTTVNPQVRAQEPIGATVDPASRPQEHQAQPVPEAFWFAVAQPRTAVDESTGAPAFVIEPGGWVLALEDRGHEFLVQHTDGRVGVLRDLSNIERG